MDKLYSDAKKIYSAAIEGSKPDVAVKKILSDINFGSSRLVVVAVGKAAWAMAKAAKDVLDEKITKGIIVTKYGHSMGDIENFEIIEAGHPVLDENSFKGTERAIELVSGLSSDDTVLFLLSGGGSALFELSELSLNELQDINRQLLASGAGINEMNCVRKHLSSVKGGRFAAMCSPAKVVSVMLSDIIDSNYSMIASGPTCPDPSTCAEALETTEKYDLKLSGKALELLHRETPKETENCEYYVCGSVRQLCMETAEQCKKLGYEPVILTDLLSCTARDAGVFLGNIARTHALDGVKRAYIAGGETVVHLTGTGLGGRNQEFALASAEEIAGIDNVCIFSVGSDGTDGPCDAAGGIVNGETKEKLLDKGIKISDVLKNNDSYNALKQVDGLIFTGPTGTNVNDVAVVLIG
jgi:hydroxypyruvate reductase